MSTTRRIVPREDGGGGLGTALRRWGPSYFTEIHANNLAAVLPDATETVKGVAELATASEVNAGTDAERIVTPAGLHQRNATETLTGLVELATIGEALAGTDTQRAVTPAGVGAVRTAHEAAFAHADIVFTDAAGAIAGTATDVVMSPATTLDVIAASLPGTYARDQRWANGGSGTATNRRTLVSPNRVAVYIDGNGYVLPAQVTKDLDTAGNWDASTYATPANRAGKDFYIYACIPSSGRTVDILLSANSTYPDGKTAANSRKVGGFHCLGVSVGPISGHPLSGYLAGDILPASVWCLNHRPACAPEGMVYHAGINRWVDIYLASINAGELASRNGAAHVTGGTTEKFHWYKFSQWLGRIGKKMLNQHEFQAVSLGSNQGTNIAGSSNPTNAGGYTDTAGRRMISNIGCESCCGVLWQWGEGDGGGQSSAAWETAFDANDAAVAGQHYLAPNRPLFGADWTHAAPCGSRGALWNSSPLVLNSLIGVRGCAEPWGGGS